MDIYDLYDFLDHCTDEELEKMYPSGGRDTE